MRKLDSTNSKDFEQEQGAKGDVLLDEELKIAHRVKRMAYLDPPASLLPSVMDAIRKRRFSWYARICKWARSPRSITFTPLQVAASAIVLILCTTFMLTQFTRNNQPVPIQPGYDRIPVRFSLNLADARSVAVIGSFNQWRPQGFEMQGGEDKQGAWTLTLDLPEGRYEYAFLIDGNRVVPDPRASLFQNDGFGNRNAVLILGTENDKAI